MSSLERKFVITIFSTYSIPTILFTIHKFDISLLDTIIIKCLSDCLLTPILVYYILKNFLPLEYLEFYVTKQLNKDKMEIYMHLYIIISISISAVISNAIYIINPSKNSYLQQLALFQFKRCILLTATSFYILYNLNRSK